MVNRISRKVIVGAGGLSLICAISVHGQEDYTQWTYNRNIVINTSASGYNIPGALNNFPYLIRLNGSSFNFTQAKGRGQDIRFSNAANAHLSYQITKWDSIGQSASLWVKVDAIAGNNATQYVRMYWGRAAAADSSKGNLVFSTAQGYAGVWHLDSGSTAADGSTQPYLDATGSGNNGYDFVGTNEAGGVSVKSASFGGGDYISIVRPVQDDFTIAFWVKIMDNIYSPTGTNWYNGNGMVDGEMPGVVNDYGVSYINNKAAYGTGNADNTIQSTTNIDNGAWHFIAATRVRTSGAKILYVDGAQQATGTGSTVTLNAPPSLYFGALQTGINYFIGYLDEVQISSNVRSADWIRLSYLNQRQPTPTLPPRIQYPSSEIIIPPNMFINQITPSYDMEQTDSLTITPMLFNYLTFDNTTGAIAGWVDGDQPRTMFIVKAYNAAGFGADTIYIRVTSTAVRRNSGTMTEGAPKLLGYRMRNAATNANIAYMIPNSANVREIRFGMYDVAGHCIWSARAEGEQLSTGIHLLTVGAGTSPKLSAGVFFIRMISIDKETNKQSSSCKTGIVIR